MLADGYITKLGLFIELFPSPDSGRILGTVLLTRGLLLDVLLFGWTVDEVILMLEEPGLEILFVNRLFAISLLAIDGDW